MKCRGAPAPTLPAPRCSLSAARPEPPPSREPVAGNDEAILDDAQCEILENTKFTLQGKEVEIAQSVLRFVLDSLNTRSLPLKGVQRCID